MLAIAINHRKPRTNNATWVWARWQVNHEWA